MIRVNIVAEGKTELRFVNQCLNRYFGGNPMFHCRCVLTSTNTKLNYEHRGGLSTYSQAKNDIVKWMKEDKSAYVSTMFDFFRLPTDFPDYERAMNCQNHADSVQILEAALKSDIESELGLTSEKDQFIPYIQLHEFEALLFCDLTVLKYDYLEPDEVKSIDRLCQDTKNILPEQINHGAETAPSKRLMHALNYKKGDAPADWIDTITIERIRTKCPHFSDWLNSLQGLKEL